MGAGTKHARDEQPVSLALSLTTADSPTTSCTTTSSAADTHLYGAAKKKPRRGRRLVARTSGEGEFVCKTCGRAFASFQALGGHRTSHLRGRRHGLELGLAGVAKAIRDRKRLDDKEKQQGHECHICGVGFEMGQALGGHMRRHREEMALRGGAGGHDQWVDIARPDQDAVAVGHAADRPPVLLELFSS